MVIPSRYILRKLRKYIFKTFSQDPRPVKHCNGVWAVIGCGIKDKPYWLIALWVDEGEDVFTYYPEAVDVEVQLDRKIEIKRSGDHNIVTSYKTLGFVDGLVFSDNEINPTLLAIIEKLSFNGVSEREICKRAGINWNKWKNLRSHPQINIALEKGRSDYLELLARNL